MIGNEILLRTKIKLLTGLENSYDARKECYREKGHKGRKKFSFKK